MKDVTSCIKPWRGARIRWTKDFWMRLRIRSVRTGNPGNWNVLVPGGKETKWDAVSKGDWNQHRANWILYSNMQEMWCCGLPLDPNWLRRTLLESRTEEGDSPVIGSQWILTVSGVTSLGYVAWIWEASTSNSKYLVRLIEYSTVRECWKEPLSGSSKILKSNSDGVLGHFMCSDVRFE